MAQKSDSARKTNFAVVLIVLAGVAAAVWAVEILVRAYGESSIHELADSRRMEGVTEELATLRKQQQDRLQTAGLPVEQAMDAVIKDAQAGAVSLVPAVGPHDKPTVPAVAGRPPDGAKIEEPVAPAEEGSGDGDPEAGGDSAGDGDAPAAGGGADTAGGDTSAGGGGSAVGAPKPDPAAPPSDGAGGNE